MSRRDNALTSVSIVHCQTARGDWVTGMTAGFTGCSRRHLQIPLWWWSLSVTRRTAVGYFDGRQVATNGFLW